MSDSNYTNVILDSPDIPPIATVKPGQVGLWLNMKDE